MSLNSNQHINENPNTSTMSSLQTDLEEIENELGRNNGTGIGRSVFRSINSALGSIRSRMERATDNTANNSAIVASASYGNMLMERLRHAELAHSARIPLDRLQGELNRRQSVADTTLNTTDVDTYANQANSKRESPSWVNEWTPSQYIPTSPRRESVLLASRRRAEDVEGENLHRVVSNAQILHPDAFMGDHYNSSDHPITLETESLIKSGDSEMPTILFTKKSRTTMDNLQQSVLFPERSPYHEPATTAPAASSIMYSWGSGVNSFHENGSDVQLIDARISSDSRTGRTDIVTCSVGEHHAACTTTSGQVLIVGSNTSGEVDPDRSQEQLIAKPSFLESLNHARIVQVSCGFNHTAALHSNGSVITWGSNEYGQLGHRSTSTEKSELSFCRPSTMTLGPDRYATAVACGDAYTICLTTRMSLLVCGVKEISGLTSDDSNNNMPRIVPALEDLPLVGIAAGRRHVVVWTAHGSAFAWGENYFGSCGREYPTRLTVPVPIKIPTKLVDKEKFLPHPLSNWAYNIKGRPHVSIPDDVAVIYASCGSNHTVLVSRSGKLFVFGANRHGQLGLDPKQYEKSCTPILVDHPNSNRQFTCADAGEIHTLLLDNFGDVWQMGGSANTFGCTQCLVGKAVRSIGAGGSHNIAIAIRPGRTMLTREFSDAIVNSENFHASGSVEELIDELAKNELLTQDEANRHVNALTKISSSAEELFRTPAVLNSLFIDPTELDDLFTKILSVGSLTSRQSIVSAIERGTRKGIDSLTADGTRCLWPEQVRFLLLYIQTPMFTESKKEGSIFDRRGDLILSLCEAIIGIPYEGYTALMCWATSVYPNASFERLLIRPLLAQLEKAMSVEVGAERRPIPGIVAVLRWLHNASSRAGNIVSPDAFYCTAISKMNPQVLYQDLQRFKMASKQKQIADFSFCGNTFLFSPATKRNLLQLENEMNMLKVAATGLTYNIEEQTYTFNPFYVLDIDREHLLTQTLQKISQAESSDLRKKLRVVFKGEDGVDAGGVTREFFQLLATQLFDFNSGMWSSRFQDGSITWFNSDCFWNDEAYYLSGILVGLAVYNSTLLDVNFPSAVYRKLLALPLGLEDMVDEDIKHGLQLLLDYDSDDVEDVFCLTFEVNWDDLGQEKVKELKPNGSNIPVTSQNKEEYVLLYVKWLLTDSIYPQYNSFEAGFMRVMEDTSLDLLHPDDLELLVVGTRDLDFTALQQNTTYDGGYTCESAVIHNFWRFVQSASFESKLNLLKFTTGSTRAPIGGLGQLQFKIQRAGPDSMNLPTSHTCFNTLLLPDYGDDYEKLTERISRAVLECEGFGLQ